MVNGPTTRNGFWRRNADGTQDWIETNAPPPQSPPEPVDEIEIPEPIPPVAPPVTPDDFAAFFDPQRTAPPPPLEPARPLAPSIPQVWAESWRLHLQRKIP